MKKSLMSALLAGVMALSVVTTGCGKNDEEKNKSEKSVKEITHSISDTIEQAEKAIKGELEFAYDANLNVTFGSVMKDLVGVELKPIDVSTSAKQKGKKTSADIAVNYDSKSLVSLNSVFDHTTETMYFKVPELSDAYLTGTVNDFAELAKRGEKLVPSEDEKSTSADIDLNKDMLNVLKGIDFEKLGDDLDTYVDLIKEKAPEAKKGDNISGEIDGHKYDYTTKSYEINGNDVKTIADAVVDKAKKDSLIKDIAIAMGCSEDEYNSSLDSALKSFIEDITGDAAEESVVINVYYNKDGEYRGWSSKDEDVDFNIVLIDNDDVFAMDYIIKFDGTEVTLKGSAAKTDDKINGEFKFNANMQEEGNFNGKFVVTDLEAKEGIFKGTISSEFNLNVSGVIITPKIVIKSNSTNDKLDLSCSLGMGDVDYVTLAMTCEKTDASDITLPTGTMYNMTNEDDMKKYMSSCDVNKLTENIKNALGEELYNAIISDSDDDIYDYENYDEDYLTDVIKEDEFDDGVAA